MRAHSTARTGSVALQGCIVTLTLSATAPAGGGGGGGGEGGGGGDGGGARLREGSGNTAAPVSAATLAAVSQNTVDQQNEGAMASATLNWTPARAALVRPAPRQPNRRRRQRGEGARREP